MTPINETYEYISAHQRKNVIAGQRFHSGLREEAMRAPGANNGGLTNQKAISYTYHTA